MQQQQHGKYHAIHWFYLCIYVHDARVYREWAHKLVSGDAFHFIKILFSLFILCCHFLVVNIDPFDLAIQRTLEPFGHSNCCMTNVMGAHHKIYFKCNAMRFIGGQLVWKFSRNEPGKEPKNSLACVYCKQSARNPYVMWKTCNPT